MPLNDTQIRNAKPRERAYRLTDAGGLQLEVRPSGGKFWRYRYRIDGRENMFAAGQYIAAPTAESPAAAAERVASGQMTLAEARRQLIDWRAAVKLGNRRKSAAGFAKHGQGSTPSTWALPRRLTNTLVSAEPSNIPLIDHEIDLDENG